jgi:hypothetical protein
MIKRLGCNNQKAPRTTPHEKIPQKQPALGTLLPDLHHLCAFIL